MDPQSNQEYIDMLPHLLSFGIQHCFHKVKEYKDPLVLEFLVEKLLFLCMTQKHFQCNLGHTYKEEHDW